MLCRPRLDLVKEPPQAILNASNEDRPRGLRDVIDGMHNVQDLVFEICKVEGVYAGHRFRAEDS